MLAHNPAQAYALFKSIFDSAYSTAGWLTMRIAEITSQKPKLPQQQAKRSQQAVKQEHLR